MNKLKLISVIFILLSCIGCNKVDEGFIGTWSNQNEKGGNLLLIITRDGENLLVKNAFADSGQVLWTHSAKVSDGYLFVDGHHFFEKMSYSESEDLLIPINTGIEIPAFHRVK